MSVEEQSRLRVMHELQRFNVNMDQLEAEIVSAVVRELVFVLVAGGRKGISESLMDDITNIANNMLFSLVGNG